MDFNPFSIKSTKKLIKEKFPEIEQISFYEQKHPGGGINIVIAGKMPYQEEYIYFMKIVSEDEDLIKALEYIILRMRKYLIKCINEEKDVYTYMYIMEARKAKYFLETDGLWPTFKDGVVQEKWSRVNKKIDMELYNELMTMNIPRSKLYEKAKRLN